MLHTNVLSWLCKTLMPWYTHVQLNTGRSTLKQITDFIHLSLNYKHYLTGNHAILKLKTKQFCNVFVYKETCHKFLMFHLCWQAFIICQRMYPHPVYWYIQDIARQRSHLMLVSTCSSKPSSSIWWNKHTTSMTENTFSC